MQESSDILEFGGLTRNPRGSETGMVQWSHKLDYDYVVRELELLTSTNVETILSEFSSNVDGTRAMYACETRFVHLSDSLKAKVALGLVIAHQLRYDPDLTVE